MLCLILQPQFDWKGISPSLPTAIATLLAAFLTVLATVMVTALTLAFSWLRERGTNARRSQIIKEATDQAAFWQKWYEAKTSSHPPTPETELASRLNTELDRIALGLHHGLVGPLKPQSLIRRALLLYQPSNSLVWLPRVIFYYLVFTVARSLIWFFWPSTFAAHVERYGDQAVDRIVQVIKSSNVPLDHLAWSTVLASIQTWAFAELVLDIIGYCIWICLFFAFILAIRAIAVDLDQDGDTGTRLMSSLDRSLNALGRPTASETLAKCRAAVRRLGSKYLPKGRTRTETS